MLNRWEKIYRQHRRQEAIENNARHWWEPYTIGSTPYDSSPPRVEDLPGQWSKEQLWDYRERVAPNGQVRRKRGHE